MDKPFGAIYRAFKPAVDNSKICNFAKVAVGKDCRSRAYGAGLFAYGNTYWFTYSVDYER